MVPYQTTFYKQQTGVLYENTFYSNLRVSPDIEFNARITKDHSNSHFKDPKNSRSAEIKSYAQEVSERLKREEAEVHHDRYVY